MKVRVLSASIAAAWLSAAFAVPSAMATDEACSSGKVTIIRVSRIKTTGSLAGFEKAFADHVKWYADHGRAQDKLVMAPVLVVDQASHSLARSPDLMMTIHTEAGSVDRSQRDAAWDAYVAEYRANSDIVTETFACME